MRKNVYKIASIVTVLILVVSIFFVMQPVKVDAGLAKTKFLGNIIANSVPSNFATYWNQVTPENGGKWGSVQSSPGSSYNWSACDTAYNYARQNGFKFRYHCLVWGQQQPSNVTSASQVQTWINAVAARYGSGSAFVDVVNEPLHAVPSYSGVLGGSGSTGWDWVVKAFEYAHNAFPSSAQLCLNDYGIISDTNAANNYKNIANIVKSRGYLDGIGIQCHQFNMDNVSTNTMRSVLSILDGVGVPIYVTELDITGDDATQKARYQEKFPVLWEHPNVAGVTLWGYIEGQTWKSGTHLITSSGAERPALQWLRTYLSGSGSTPTPTRRGSTPTPTGAGGPTPTQGSGTIVQCENMTLSGTYAGKISSPFSGVALYANNDACYYTQYFANSVHSFSVRGCSNNSSAARVDLRIGGQTKGSFYFTGTTPTVQTLSNISHGTGNQEVRLTITTDNGTWDAYVDYLQIN
ncbi:MAG: endo-1,4-beta-xylanase [Firmicutes bacterium]|nr:endo-1,4-beta-xylanase [Bacillota bacterium]